jgi:hypothetical protein
MIPYIPSKPVLHPPDVAGMPITPAHIGNQPWILKRLHPIPRTDNGIVTTHVLHRKGGAE